MIRNIETNSRISIRPVYFPCCYLFRTSYTSFSQLKNPNQFTAKGFIRNAVVLYHFAFKSKLTDEITFYRTLLHGSIVVVQYVESLYKK